MSDIKIFVSHRIDLNSEIIQNPLYIPVRCGAVFDEKQITVSNAPGLGIAGIAPGHITYLD